MIYGDYLFIHVTVRLLNKTMPVIDRLFVMATAVYFEKMFKKKLAGAGVARLSALAPFSDR